MQFITRQAFAVAYRLAQFYGHEWARRPLEIPDWATGPQDLRAHIRVETVKARGNSLPGIAEPNLKWDTSVSSWEIHHKHGIGRGQISYYILWDEFGYEPLSLTIDITWPGGQGDIHYTHKIGTPKAEGGYGGVLEARHWRALVEPITWLDGNTNQLEIAFPDRPWEAFIQPSKDPERWWEYVEDTV